MSKQSYPYQVDQHEPTKKQVWLASFTALLTHMAPDDAIVAADRALELCNKRWEEPQWVRTWQFSHNYPVGHRFTVRYEPDNVLGSVGPETEIGPQS